MFLILKLILIILLNKTYAYITQDSEIILLPAWNPTGAKEMSLTLKVFGKFMQLKLRRNDQIVSPEFEVWKNNVKGSNSCFYFHEDYVSFAVINICQEHGLEGLVYVENDIIEIRPLQNAFASLSFIDDSCVREQINLSFGNPHLIKRSLQYFANPDYYYLHKIISKRHDTSSTLYVDKTPKEQANFTIELAVFFDAEVYSTFMYLVNHDIGKVYNMMLAYVNQIQAFFHHPSLGVLIDISLVRLEIMEAQLSRNFSNYSNSNSAMRNSFCQYATNLNPPNDDDLRHWDIGLYIMAKEIIELSTKIVGRARINGACSLRISCAIATLLTDELKHYSFTKITPPLLLVHKIDQLIGLKHDAQNVIHLIQQSSLTATHEIGHLLGLIHDSNQSIENIMYPWEQEYHSGMTWSSLSRNMIKKKLEKKSCLRDRAKPKNFDYGDNWSTYAFDNSTCDYPGRKQTAKAQCELFLSDKDANVVTLHDICQNLQCETPHKNKSYFAGRALNGTYCAFGKECCGGKCVPVIEPPYNFKCCNRDNWSEWKKDSCKSDCLKKSKGRLVKRRFCKHRIHKTANCAGPYYDMVLCNDFSLCTERLSIAEFTAIKCIEFRKFAKDLNMTIKLLMASGIQFFHDVEKPWIACTVFCRREDTPDWYAPRQEMLDYGVDPYFPDGTWCHNEGGQDYYCRQHHCLPENYSFVESEKCQNNC